MSRQHDPRNELPHDEATAAQIVTTEASRLVLTNAKKTPAEILRAHEQYYAAMVKTIRRRQHAVNAKAKECKP